MTVLPSSGPVDVTTPCCRRLRQGELEGRHDEVVGVGGDRVRIGDGRRRTLRLDRREFGDGAEEGSVEDGCWRLAGLDLVAPLIAPPRPGTGCDQSEHAGDGGVAQRSVARSALRTCGAS